jgi:hypothetical protein
MAAQYSYLATDLLTGTVLGEVPLHGVTFDRQINKAGNWQGSANLDDPLIDNDDLLLCTNPGRTAIYVYRNDQIVWGGIIWSRTYQSQAKALQMTAQTFESYAYKVYYRPSATVNYSEAQCSIINKLWITLQQQQNASIGVMEPLNLPANDVVRTLTVNPWDFKTYGEIIDDPLMNFDDSAEWTIECFEQRGVPTKRLTLGYPQLGRRIDFTNLVVDYPGNILNYYWSESASSSGNRAWATGDGDEGAITVGVATNNSSLNAGYPLLEVHETHQGVTVQATINAHALKDLSDNILPKINKTIQIKADEQPEFGSYGIGDDAKFEVVDPRFPDGLEDVIRVIGWNVTPSSSDAVEEIALIIEGSDDSSGGDVG